MLSERKKEVLKIIIEEYIRTAKPVGSNLVCEVLDCSSATIRNEMMELEELGLLEKTHISSGRIPSEKGYRFYVDNLMEPKNMTGEDVLKLQTIFKNNSLVISDVVKRSIEIVSELTNYTAVILGDKAMHNLLKKVEVVPLDSNKILTMVITDKGYVEHKNMSLTEDISSEEVKKTVDIINRLLIGTPLDEISEKLEYEVKPVIIKYVKQHEVLYDAFYNAFSEFQGRKEAHFTGKNNFLTQPEFNNVEKIREIFTKFEDESSIRKIMEDKNGINIYIGKESEIDEDVAIIKTKYNHNGETGTIAIIGPKRMEYDRVVGILDYIKDNIDI